MHKGLLQTRATWSSTSARKSTNCNGT